MCKKFWKIRSVVNSRKGKRVYDILCQLNKTFTSHPMMENEKRLGTLVVAFTRSSSNKQVCSWAEAKTLATKRDASDELAVPDEKKKEGKGGVCLCEWNWMGGGA